jgi:hypothetical protein
MKTLWQTLVLVALSAGMLWAQNVGIGTATPQTRLHVHGAGGVTDGIRVTSTGANGPTINFYAGTATPDAGHISFGDNTGWKFHITRASDGTNLVTVQDNGNVGIGTVTPTQRLHVVGNVQFSGALMPGGIAGTTGQVLVSQGPGVAPNWFSLLSELNSSGNPTGNTGFKICFGESNAWFNCNGSNGCGYNTGVIIDINMSGCGFTSTPYVFTAIKGTSSHWMTTGATSIYFLTSTSFRVYLHGYLYSGSGLNTTVATNNQYTLMWMAIGR